MLRLMHCHSFLSKNVLNEPQIFVFQRLQTIRSLGGKYHYPYNVLYHAEKLPLEKNELIVSILY
jgi:hypothetical protein